MSGGRRGGAECQVEFEETNRGTRFVLPAVVPPRTLGPPVVLRSRAEFISFLSLLFTVNEFYQIILSNAISKLEILTTLLFKFISLFKSKHLGF